MNRKILLIEPKRTFEQINTLEVHYTYPQLGLLSIAANLEKQGHQVDFFRTDSYQMPFMILRKILEKQYDFIGISSITETVSHQLKMAKFIKKHLPQTKIVFGGPHAWLHPQEILINEQVDYAVRGLGEIPFIKLVAGINSSKIPGLCFKRNKKLFIKKPFYPQLKDLQTLASLLDYSKYNEIYQEAKTFRNSRQLFTSFGCPFNCNFCSVPKLYQGKMFFRKIDSVVEEVIKLSKKTRRIMFVDPDLNINKKHFMELFRKIVSEKKQGNLDKKTRFVIQARLDCFDNEMLNLAKEVNIIILVGIESLSQKIRDFDLNKGGKLAKMDKEKLLEKIEEVKKYVTPYYYFILATPETKMKDLIDNLKYIKTLPRGWYEINIYITPFKETNYFQKFQKTKYLVWRKRKSDYYPKVPQYLRCKSKSVEKLVEKSIRNASRKKRRNSRLSYTNLLLNELFIQTKVN